MMRAECEGEYSEMGWISRNGVMEAVMLVVVVVVVVVVVSR